MPYASRMRTTDRARRYTQGARGRGRAAAATARTTVTKYPKSTTRNKPVFRKLRKPFVPYRVKNRMAITTIARQVKSLQNRIYGDIDTMTQYANFNGVGAPVVTSVAPFLFMLNDFTNCPVYQGTPPVNGIPSYATTIQFQPQQYAQDMDDAYEWNARRNNTSVSPIEYKPVYTRVQFTFDYDRQGLSSSLDPDAVFRVTILKLKPRLATTSMNVNLPGALGAYRYLAVDGGTNRRNYFDKTLHTVLYDKWLKFPNYNKTADDNCRYSRTLTISWRFKDHVLRPDFNQNPPNQEMWSNVPVQDQLWCMISRNDSQQSDVKFNIARFNVWRDARGSG